MNENREVPETVWAIVNSGAMSKHLTKSATTNAELWRFFRAGVQVLANAGILETDRYDEGHEDGYREGRRDRL